MTVASSRAACICAGDLPGLAPQNTQILIERPTRLELGFRLERGRGSALVAVEGTGDAPPEVMVAVSTGWYELFWSFVLLIFLIGVGTRGWWYSKQHKVREREALTSECDVDVRSKWAAQVVVYY
jgi:hypothetical protein